MCYLENFKGVILLEVSIVNEKKVFLKYVGLISWFLKFEFIFVLNILRWFLGCWYDLKCWFDLSDLGVFEGKC